MTNGIQVLMSDLSEYIALIKNWEAKYGTPARVFRYDPTEIRASCVKCGKMKSKMSRHHKANDFLFARMLPDVYARRYIEFHTNDVAKLCDDCHKDIHRYYKPLMKELWMELQLYGSRVITKEWCDEWKDRFLKLFEKWIKKPVKKRKRHRVRKKRTF